VSEEITFDQFQLTNCIATGSFSQIWEAIDQETNERYAMKLLLEEAFREAEHKATLKREFKIASTFDHPNIIKVFTHRQTKKYAYYTMEFFGGPNLKQIIRGDQLVVHTRLRKLIECVVMALGNIHDQGWLHRDIKPDNIMLTKASDVRLIDFSLSAKAPSKVAKMLSGKSKHIQGTRTYIAPELIRKKLPSVQSDFYSLGVSIFECLTGRPPFLGTTPNDLLIKHVQEPPPPPSAFNTNVTPEMDKLVLRLMAKKPENRPENTGELLSELRSLKIFIDDPQIYQDALKVKEKEAAAVVEEASIDSRADALRSERISAGLEVEKPKPKLKKTPVKSQQPATAKPVAQQQVQPLQPQQQPGYPQQPMMPQQPGMPGQGWSQPVAGQQPMTGYPMQQQLPGQPIQQPAVPPGYPQQVPGQVPPQQQQPISPQQTPPAQPASPTEKQTKKTVPPPVVSKQLGNEVNLDDLPLMDELPDIS